MSARLPVGVIGVGALGQHHARHLANLDEVHLVGVYDSDDRRAETVANSLDTRAFGEMDDLLSEIEAVTIAVPTPGPRGDRATRTEAGSPGADGKATSIHAH